MDMADLLPAPMWAKVVEHADTVDDVWALTAVSRVHRPFRKDVAVRWARMVRRRGWCGVGGEARALAELLASGEDDKAVSQIVWFALRSGADPTAKAEGVTSSLLEFAACAGRTESVRMLLLAGAAHGPSTRADLPALAGALTVAAASLRIWVVRCVLESPTAGVLLTPDVLSAAVRAAAVNSAFRPGPNRGTPPDGGEGVDLAAAVVRELLDHCRGLGPGVERRVARGADLDGRTALMAAATTGAVGVLEALLEAGADAAATVDGRYVVGVGGVDGGGGDRDTALTIAARFWHGPAVAALLGCEQQRRRRAPGADVQDAAAAAAELDQALLGALDELSIRCAAHHDEGRPLLACMDLTGSPMVVSALLDAGASPLAADDMFGGGDTPLTTAAEAGYLPVVELLVAAGAEIDDGPGDGHETPLMRAASNGNADAVRLLLRAGADVGRVDAIGFDAVAWSVGSLETLETLLAGGARLFHAGAGRPGERDGDGDGDGEELEYLQRARKARDDALVCTAARYGSADVLRFLLASGGDPNAANPHAPPPGERALDAALQVDDAAEAAEAAELLIAAGAVPSAAHVALAGRLHGPDSAPALALMLALMLALPLRPPVAAAIPSDFRRAPEPATDAERSSATSIQ